MKKLLITLFSVLAVLGTCRLQAQNGNPLPDYPWLSDLVSTNTCTTEKVEVYDGFLNSYILVTDADGVETMYNTEGQFYCQNAPNYDCIAAYRLNPAPVLTWECSGDNICEGGDPFDLTILSVTRNANPNPSACAYSAEISQFDYQGSVYFKVQEEARTASECASIDYGSYFVDCRGTVVGGFRPSYWNCQSSALCDNLQAASNNAAVIWRRGEEDSCTNQDPFSLPALQTAINTPPRLKADGSACWYIKHIIEFQFEGKTFYRIVEDTNPDQLCRVEWGTRFYTCDGELVGGTGIYPECDDAALCIYDIPTLNEAARATGTIIWDSGIGQEEQNPMFNIFPWLLDLVNPDNCSSGRVELYTGNAQHPYSYLLVTTADGSTKLYNTSGNVYCEQTTPGSCIAPYVAAYGLSSTPYNTWECASTNCICPQVVIPVCGVDGNTYNNSCEAACAGVAVAFDSPCNIDPPSQCTVTITNTQCRIVGVYDEADNLLVTMNAGPQPNGPPNQPTSVWEDTRSLTTRTYIFKDGDLEIGRQTATCANPSIEVVSQYFSGCTDAVGLSSVTNVGCRDLQVFDTRGNLLQSAAMGETLFLQEIYKIYILKAGMDTLGIGLGFGEADIDTKGCTEDTPCLITIRNNECRTVGVYDEADNFLFEIEGTEALSSPIRTRTDSRPLSANETRTYIFKDGDLEIGRQTTSCDNFNTIVVKSAYFDGCTDVVMSSILTNVGCQDLQVFDTGGNLLYSATPGESITLSFVVETIHVLMSGADTLRIGVLVRGDIDTKGCAEDTPCLIKIINKECRPVGIYDEADNFLTTMGSADPGPPPFSRPTPTWTDDRLLAANETRIYIFKDGNLEIGRDTVTCDKPIINVVSKYFSGCTDAVRSSLLTNVGCREIQVFDTRGNLLQSATQGESISIFVLDRIYVVMAGSDTLQVGTFVGGNIDTEGCSENAPCLVAITNNECRTVGVYDEEDNLIITLAALPIPNSPLPQTPHRRLDPRPLAQGETRTYTFKENNFILGRQTVTCANTEIAVVSNQFNACTDALFSREVTNTGCRVIQVFNTSSELINSVVPGEVFRIENRDISILIAGTDTLTFNNNSTVDSGGCEEEGGGGSEIFIDYPWLNDLGNPVGICPIKEVEVWQSGIYTYLLVTDDRGTETLYNENGQFYCQNSANYNCLTAYNLNNLVGQWACESIVPASECLVTITSKECRYLRIYDENDVLLTVKDGRPSAIRPNGTWEDTRPLAAGDTRTYIFKDGDLVLGRQIATCANPNIDLVNRYGDGCAEEFGPSEITNVGCNLLKVFNVGGGLHRRAFPGETISLEGAKRYLILVANQDTLGVDYEFGVRDIDTGGCPDNTNYNNVQIFDDYPWLSDKVDRTNCSNERVEVWQARTTTYIWVEDENGNGTLYTENGQVQCRPAPSFPINCFQAYELKDLKAIWICGRTTNPGEMEEETSNPTIFNDYPWLTDKVDPNNCTNEKVAVYQSGIYTYLLVTSATGEANLYNQNGQFYCKNSSNYDCVAAYNLGTPIDTWTCSDTPPPPPLATCDIFRNVPSGTDLCDACYEDISVYEFRGESYIVYRAQTPDCRALEIQVVNCATNIGYCVTGPNIGLDGNCPIFWAEATLVETLWTDADCSDTNVPDCASNTGTIFFENCDNGVLYYFVRTDDGRVYDPYFDASITFTPIEGQRVNFDFVDASFPSPCSNAEKAITVTCIEKIDNVNPNVDPIFSDFPWLNDIVNPTACNGERITVYQAGSFQYVYIESATGSSLYFEAGTFYCSDSPNYDCRAAYGLSQIADTWQCATFNLPASEERGNTPVDAPEFTAFPNPTTGRLTIQLGLPTEHTQQLLVMDVLGRQLIQQEITPFTRTLEIDLSDYKNGVYYIELQASGQRFIEKLVKQGL